MAVLKLLFVSKVSATCSAVMRAGDGADRQPLNRR
jgi:hypothetical protein